MKDFIELSKPDRSLARRGFKKELGHTYILRSKICDSSIGKFMHNAKRCERAKGSNLDLNYGKMTM